MAAYDNREDGAVFVELIRQRSLREGVAGIRFAHDASAFSQVKCPCLVQVLDYGRNPADGALYLVAAPPEGEPLRQRLERDGPLSPAAALSVAGDLLTALQAVHAAGLVHRGVSVANVAVRDDNETVRAQLLTFGADRGGAIPDPKPDLRALAELLNDVLERAAYVPPLLREFIEEARSEQDGFEDAATLREALERVVGATQALGSINVMAPGEVHDETGPMPVARVGFAATTPGTNRETRRLVVRVMTSIGRAFRNFALYPSDNPMFQLSAKDVCRALDGFFALQERLEVIVDRFAIRYEGEVVYEDADIHGSFPYRLHNDGIRRLSVASGLGHSEMIDWLNCLHQVAGIGNLSDDVVTAMWSQTFPHITFHTVDELICDDAGDSLAGFGDEIARSDDGDGDWFGVRSQRAVEARMPTAAAARPRLDQWLQQDHLLALRDRLEAQQGDRLTELLALMIDALGRYEDTPEQEGLIRVLDNALGALLVRRDYMRVLMIVKAARRLIEAHTVEAFRLDLEHLVDMASDEEAVVDMVDQLINTADPNEAAQIARLFTLLDPSAGGHVAQRLDTIPPQRMPMTQLALMRLCRRFPWRLTPGLRSPRPAVILATLRVLREIRSEQANNEVRGLINHASPEVRVAALQVLSANNDPGLMDAAKMMLDDADPAARLGLISALPKLTAEQSDELLVLMLDHADLPHRTPEEIAALFNAIVRSGRDAVVAALEKQLDEQHTSALRLRARMLASSLFSRERQDLIEPSLRALMRIDTAAAHRALAAARQHATRAVRRTLERIGGPSEAT